MTFVKARAKLWSLGALRVTEEWRGQEGSPSQRRTFPQAAGHRDRPDQAAALSRLLAEEEAKLASPG